MCPTGVAPESCGIVKAEPVMPTVSGSPRQIRQRRGQSDAPGSPPTSPADGAGRLGGQSEAFAVDLVARDPQSR